MVVEVGMVSWEGGQSAGGQSAGGLSEESGARYQHGDGGGGGGGGGSGGGGGGGDAGPSASCTFLHHPASAPSPPLCSSIFL